MFKVTFSDNRSITVAADNATSARALAYRIERVAAVVDVVAA